MADVDAPTPNTESSDYKAMVDDWVTISDILQGARRIKEQGLRYLPQYEEEETGAYELRLRAAPWRPELADALMTVCAKPFTKDVALQGESTQAIKEFAEDVDGKGSNLHVFAREVFRKAVAKGLHAIYVTFPDADPAQTRAEELARGVRPYWLHIEADDIIACYTMNIYGFEVITHMRYRVSVVEKDPDGFGEIERKQVRVLELDAERRPTSTLYEKDEKASAEQRKEVWLVKEETVVLEGVELIPVVLFFTGERTGHYRVKPPFAELAHMQLEIYRCGSRKDEILTYAGSPMLVASGMAAPDEKRDSRGNVLNDGKIKTGPKTILFAPPGNRDGVQTSWDFIQPNPGNITEIREDLNDLLQDFRRLAMQPMTQRSGTLTATGSAIEGAKAHSAIEAWAMVLKDCLEWAFVFTCQWMNESEAVEVFVHTDFGIDLLSQDSAELLQAYLSSAISLDTYWDEMLRRGKLGPQFDKDMERLRLFEAQQALAVNEGADPVETGEEFETV